jgi:CRP-like cAMP-binding protein
MAPARVAGFLLDLARPYGATAPIDLQMSRRNMADALDLSVEMVCRVLSQFAEARFIAIPNGTQVEILDVTALEAITDTDRSSLVPTQCLTKCR